MNGEVHRHENISSIYHQSPIHHLVLCSASQPHGKDSNQMGLAVVEAESLGVAFESRNLVEAHT